MKRLNSSALTSWHKNFLFHIVYVQAGLSPTSNVVPFDGDGSVTQLRHNFFVVSSRACVSVLLRIFSVLRLQSTWQYPAAVHLVCEMMPHSWSSVVNSDCG